MPIWVIEAAADGRLNSLFLLIGVMTAPVWLAMLLVPRAAIVRHLATPFVLPVCFIAVPAIIAFETWNTAAMPGRFIEGTSYRDAQALVRNPAPFLLFFANLQICNLAIGTVIYQASLRQRIRVPVELLLTWFAGPAGLFAFAVRSLLAGRLPPRG